MRAFIARIERVNPKVNAIVTFLPDQALKRAKALDRKGAAAGPLAGLPIAHKDIVPTKGIRTTFGSPIYSEHVPGEDHVIVSGCGQPARSCSQDQHAGIRGGRADPQSGLRGHAQSQ